MDKISWQSPDLRGMSDGGNVSTGTEDNADTQASLSDEEEEDGIILDPKHSERYTWCDVRTKIEREIWRPGDGDGERATDYYAKVEPPNKIEDRWRLYQLSLGPIKHEHHEPPKYVFLDDRACYEVLQSKIPRASLGKFWPHDFGISGKIRDRRPHRGRGSVGDPDAEGNNQFHFTQVGIKNAKYYFTGEKGFIPIIYRSEELKAEIAKKLEKKRKGWSIRNKGGDPRTRGHNQFTPKDRLIKNGAPSSSKSNRKRSKLGDHKVPEWLLDKPKAVEGVDGVQADVLSYVKPSHQGHYALHQGFGSDVSEDARDSYHKERRPDDDAIAADGGTLASSGQLFPFDRQTVGHQTVPSGLYNPLATIGNGYHQESSCPYTESRVYASQLERDLAAAQDVISEQKVKIAELDALDVEKQNMIEDLQRELQDLRWSIAR